MLWYALVQVAFMTLVRCVKCYERICHASARSSCSVRDLLWWSSGVSFEYGGSRMATATGGFRAEVEAVWPLLLSFLARIRFLSAKRPTAHITQHDLQPAGYPLANNTWAYGHWLCGIFLPWRSRTKRQSHFWTKRCCGRAQGPAEAKLAGLPRSRLGVRATQLRSACLLSKAISDIHWWLSHRRRSRCADWAKVTEPVCH